jgi:hypothetical protein
MQINAIYIAGMLVEIKKAKALKACLCDAKTLLT